MSAPGSAASSGPAAAAATASSGPALFGGHERGEQGFNQARNEVGAFGDLIIVIMRAGSHSTPGLAGTENARNNADLVPVRVISEELDGLYRIGGRLLLHGGRNHNSFGGNCRAGNRLGPAQLREGFLQIFARQILLNDCSEGGLGAVPAGLEVCAHVRGEFLQSQQLSRGYQCVNSGGVIPTQGRGRSLNLVHSVREAKLGTGYAI